MEGVGVVMEATRGPASRGMGPSLVASPCWRLSSLPCLPCRSGFPPLPSLPSLPLLLSLPPAARFCARPGSRAL